MRLCVPKTKRAMKRAICAALCVAGTVTCAFARAAAEQDLRNSEPVFDVASVKPVEVDGPRDYAAQIVQIVRNMSQSKGGPASLTLDPGGRWVFRFSTLRSILQSVYPA